MGTTLRWTLVTLMASAGCGGYPPPKQSLAQALNAVELAEQAGAEQTPEAAHLLHLAQEQSLEAKRLMDAGDNERAELLTQRARSDAELALVLAREEAAMARAKELRAQLREQAEDAQRGAQ